ncbi:SHOCT domain-containing protein [Microbaculum marinisediminis]|uniref:SHOCT domain-containing protein n=1 Tax=Microbaculum marinisediminis TaxID=2931392 RepID=A0AAW5QVD1_9HYPH|nr:SHOCT domain-containing protein [Microbaculum sp. A6E488]MCT8971852.1 SHOCT domain-containing protein [Microbaculum sp. A6E488]
MSRSTILAACLMGVFSAVFGVTGPAWAQGGMGYYGHSGSHMGFGGGFGWIFGPLFMLALIAAIVAVIVLMVRWIGGGSGQIPPQAQPSGKTPLDILQQRFARGEIDKAEYEERRRVLED